MRRVRQATSIVVSAVSVESEESAATHDEVHAASTIS
jgi:hypothetical protein